jgi:hypothetical protein
MSYKLTTPIAFIVFNRPDTTAKVFEAIRQAQPPKLLIIADGARPDRIGEAEKCQQVREICDRVDWECEVLKNYSDLNLGCKKRVSSGLDWVFREVEEAIILEDDCVPEPTFFQFCQELLERYHYDNRIMAISGNNFQFGIKRTDHSYYFSSYCHAWGWATWRRAWQYFDVDMNLFPVIKNTNWLETILKNKRSIKYWQNNFERACNKQQSSIWDYQWQFACWTQNGLIVLPSVNLVSNIGFGEDSTNTKSKSLLTNMATGVLTFPIQHPNFLIRDIDADNFTEENFYSTGFINKIKNKIYRK